MSTSARQTESTDDAAFAQAFYDLLAADRVESETLKSFADLTHADQTAIKAFIASKPGSSVDPEASAAENEFYVCKLGGDIMRKSYTLASLNDDPMQVLVLLSEGKVLGYNVLGGEN